jgi:transmembrane sensor
MDDAFSVDLLMTTQSIQDQALGWFARLNDADAPESDWLEFQAWLEADPEHGRSYTLIEQLWVTLDDAAAGASPAGQIVVVPVAANDAGPAREPRWLRGRRWLAPLLAVAATTVLTIGLWPEISGAGRFRSYATTDAPLEVTLSDGSRLSLNRHSSVRTRIGNRGRTVTLTEGEVAFDVAHDVDRPFVIDADNHTVRVLGTAFNVLSHDDRFSVGVSRGLVSVSGRSMPDTIRLGAGEQVDQTGANAPVVSQTPPEQTSAWRKGVLIYNEADLATVSDDLSRYFGKPVNISPSARALHFTGALRIGDEATMLRQLQEFLPIQVTQDSRGILLTTRDGA